MQSRILGFDVARAFAIFGMVIVNFKIVMGATTGSAFLIWFAGIFHGRASALFVVLAGIGIAFLTKKAHSCQDLTLILAKRKALIKRGLLLIIIGLAYTPIWPADILHFYGFYFLIASFLFNLSDKKLLILTAFVALMFPVLLMLFDYNANWDWSALTYHQLWTFDGLVRRIFFNGFHPVFPWVSFLLLGIWLGRQNLLDKNKRKQLLKYSLIIWITTELFFWTLNLWLSYNLADNIGLLLTTSVIPPMPQYIIAASSLAIVLIIISLNVSEKYSNNIVVKYFYQTGQMSLTLYVAHVIIGMSILDYLNLLKNQTIELALFSVLSFCIFAVMFSVVWLKYFKVGPLEWFFRKIINL